MGCCSCPLSQAIADAEPRKPQLLKTILNMCWNLYQYQIKYHASYIYIYYIILYYIILYYIILYYIILYYIIYIYYISCISYIMYIIYHVYHISFQQGPWGHLPTAQRSQRSQRSQRPRTRGLCRILGSLLKCRRLATVQRHSPVVLAALRRKKHLKIISNVSNDIT